MATLLDTFNVKQMAFEWGGIKRVFRTNDLTVYGDEDLQAWVSASRKRNHEFLGVWLIFEVSSTFLQRVSPTIGTDNDWIDVQNALLDNSKTVKFYPIYDLNPSLNYIVGPENKKKPKVLEIKRGLTYPEAQLTVATISQLAEYPAWLKQTRTRG